MSVDLRTRYLGLELRSPIVASAAPDNAEPTMAARLEAAGVGAIVLPSLFEEEIVAEELPGVVVLNLRGDLQISA